MGGRGLGGGIAAILLAAPPAGVGRGSRLRFGRMRLHAEPGEVVRLVLGEQFAARAALARRRRGPPRPVVGRIRLRPRRHAPGCSRLGGVGARAGAHVLEHCLVMGGNRRSGNGRIVRGCRPVPSALPAARLPARGPLDAHDGPEVVQGDPVVVDPQVKAPARHEPPYRQAAPPVIACAVDGHVRVAPADAGRHGHLVDDLAGADLGARVAVPHERRQLAVGIVGRRGHQVVRPLCHAIGLPRCNGQGASGGGPARAARRRRRPGPRPPPPPRARPRRPPR